MRRKFEKYIGILVYGAIIGTIVRVIVAEVYRVIQSIKYTNGDSGKIIFMSIMSFLLTALIGGVFAVVVSFLVSKFGQGKKYRLLYYLFLLPIIIVITSFLINRTFLMLVAGMIITIAVIVDVCSCKRYKEFNQQLKNIQQQ